MDKKEKIKMVAKLLEERIGYGNATYETYCHIKVVDNEELHITPHNRTTFFHLKEVAEAITPFKLSAYNTIKHGTIEVVIF